MKCWPLWLFDPIANTIHKQNDPIRLKGAIKRIEANHNESDMSMLMYLICIYIRIEPCIDSVTQTFFYRQERLTLQIYH